MKFACVLLILAFAAGVQSSGFAPVHSWGYGHGHGHGPAAVAIHTSAPWGHDGGWGHGGGWGHDAGWGHGGAWGHGGYPGISLSQGPGGHGDSYGHGYGHGYGYGDGHGHGHGHEAVYVAKTPGAVHKAPLAGHIKSVSSVNVAPAPGTHLL